MEPGASPKLLLPVNNRSFGVENHWVPTVFKHRRFVSPNRDASHLFDTVFSLQLYFCNGVYVTSVGVWTFANKGTREDEDGPTPTIKSSEASFCKLNQSADVIGDLENPSDRPPKPRACLQSRVLARG
jgi:hypothetical protein